MLRRPVHRDKIIATRSSRPISGNSAKQQTQKSGLVRLQTNLRIGRCPARAACCPFRRRRCASGSPGTDRVEWHRPQPRGRRAWAWSGAIAAGHPLVIEQRQLVSERRAVGKDRFAILGFEMDLRRVERHHEDRHSGSQQRLQSSRIAVDVPLRIRRPALAVGPS